MPTYGEEYRQRFEWKMDAKAFVAQKKKESKRGFAKLFIKIEPEVSFESGKHGSESRIIGYVVVWHYLPKR